MKTKLSYFIVLLLCFGINNEINAQSDQILKPLSIGDKVPEITISNIINYKGTDGKLATTAKISDFKGKMLILDFWATWCGSCIANFPKMEALQNEFGNKVQMLAVAYEDKKKINSFFSSKVGQQYHITSVTNDNLLKVLFPHRIIPHCIWIDENGIVQAITSAEEVTSANIKEAFANKKNPKAVKVDIDSHEPLFIGKELHKEQLVQYSILLKGKYNGLPNGIEKRTRDNIPIGLAIMNDPLLIMYKIVMWRLMPNFGENRLVIESSDAEALSKDIYSYDLILPKVLSDSLYHYMLNDLNRYTNYNARVEKRKVVCLILTKDNLSDKFKTKGGLPENSLFFNQPARLTNRPISDLLVRLSVLKGITQPIVDETGYSGNIDVEFQNGSDLKSIEETLKASGLILTTGERELEMFVIRDKSVILSRNNEQN